MALITCPECGQSVSDHADACPKCGYPVGAMIEKQKKDVDDLCNLGCKYLMVMVYHGIIKRRQSISGMQQSRDMLQLNITSD